MVCAWPSTTPTRKQPCCNGPMWLSILDVAGVALRVPACEPHCHVGPSDRHGGDERSRRGSGSWRIATLVRARKACCSSSTSSATCRSPAPRHVFGPACRVHEMLTEVDRSDAEARQRRVAPREPRARTGYARAHSLRPHPLAERPPKAAASVPGSPTAERRRRFLSGIGVGARVRERCGATTAASAARRMAVAAAQSAIERHQATRAWRTMYA